MAAIRRDVDLFLTSEDSHGHGYGKGPLEQLADLGGKLFMD